MNLKKLFCTLAAVALSSAVFSGETTKLKQTIDAFFKPLESYPAETADARRAMNTVKAIKAGLMTYEIHLAQGKMSQQDKEIERLLDMVPAYYNMIVKSVDEVEHLMPGLLNQLANAVLANQTQFKEDALDAEKASMVVDHFAFQYAKQTGSILQDVVDIMEAGPFNPDRGYLSLSLFGLGED